MNQKRGTITKQYIEGIKNIDQIELIVPFDEHYVYQMFGIRVQEKNDLIVYLKNNGVATDVITPPLSLQPLFKQWGLNCPYIEKEIDRCITLPLHPDLKSNEVEYIISLLESFYERK